MWLGILSLLVSVFAADSPKLQHVKAFSKDGEFITELVFDKNFDETNIATDYINETVQFNIPNVSLSKGKVSTVIHDSKVQTVYAYRLSDNLTRVRVIYKKGQKVDEYKNSTVIENEGNILRFKIADRKSVVAEPAPVAAVETAPRNLSDEKKEDLSIKDDDLKQAASWIEDSKNAPKQEAAIAPVAAVAQEQAPAAPKVIVADENLKEDEIPVLANASPSKILKKDSPVAKAIVSLGIVLGMIAGGFFFLKKWAKAKGAGNKNTQIKVLTQHYLGPKKSLAIIRVAGESILVGITDHNITMIKSLSLLDEEIPSDTPSQFGKSLDSAEMAQDFKTTDEADEFSMTKIIGQKLKGMKEI